MINTREIAAELRLSHWAGIMQERTREGLSIKAFCRKIGICQNTYFYWQRRVRAAVCQSFPTQPSELIVKPQTKPDKIDKALIPKGWAICEPAPEVAVDEKPLSIEIGGCRVLVNESVNPELLSKVCKVLVGLC